MAEARSGATVDVAEPRVRAETRDRPMYYAELRAAVHWEAAVTSFTERWEDHERR